MESKKTDKPSENELKKKTVSEDQKKEKEESGPLPEEEEDENKFGGLRNSESFRKNLGCGG